MKNALIALILFPIVFLDAVLLLEISLIIVTVKSENTVSSKEENAAKLVKKNAKHVKI